MAPVVTMRQLLESGVHFGHQTRRWNPKMKRFIFTERNGIYIIDLQQSLQFIDRAYDFIKETVAHGGSILYVGTKKQAQEAIAEQARRVGMPFVNQRWLGGMLTNFTTVYKRLQRLKELEEIDFDDTANSNLTKKELLQLRRERDKLERSLGGIRDMARIPSAIWVVDTKKEHIAVSEARKLNIPVVAILDTNCDPDEVNYPIPGNDDAIRSVALLTRVVADAVADGLIARAGAAAGEEKPEGANADIGAAEPLAEWERELLEGKLDGTAEPTVAAANGAVVNGSGAGTSAPGSAAARPARTTPVAAAPAAKAAAVQAAPAEAAQSAVKAAAAQPAKAEAAQPAAKAAAAQPAKAEAAQPAVKAAAAQPAQVEDAKPAADASPAVAQAAAPSEGTKPAADASPAVASPAAKAATEPAQPATADAAQADAQQADAEQADAGQANAEQAKQAVTPEADAAVEGA